MEKSEEEQGKRSKAACLIKVDSVDRGVYQTQPDQVNKTDLRKS